MRTPPPPERARILVVEDNDEVRSAVRELLEENGFLVSEAKNGVRTCRDGDLACRRVRQAAKLRLGKQGFFRDTLGVAAVT